MSTNPYENADLDRAERAVARLPRRRLLPVRGPASRIGRALTVVAPLSAVAAVAAQLTFATAPTSVEAVWFALVALVTLTVVLSVAAGEFGGRAGRVSGIASGVLIVPPIGLGLAWWVLGLFGLVS